MCRSFVRIRLGTARTATFSGAPTLHANGESWTLWSNIRTSTLCSPERAQMVISNPWISGDIVLLQNSETCTLCSRAQNYFKRKSSLRKLIKSSFCHGIVNFPRNAAVIQHPDERIDKLQLWIEAFTELSLIFPTKSKARIKIC